MMINIMMIQTVRSNKITFLKLIFIDDDDDGSVYSGEGKKLNRRKEKGRFGGKGKLIKDNEMGNNGDSSFDNMEQRRKSANNKHE